MDIKPFLLNGFQIDLQAEKLLVKMVRTTVCINGKRVNNIKPDILGSEFEKTAERLEQLLKKNLSF